LQAFEVVIGQRLIPEGLDHFVYEKGRSPPTDRLARTLAEGADEFLLEVSDHRQFSLGEVMLQQNFVSRRLIQPYRGALLDWYRQISREGAADEACVSAALGKLEAGGFPHDAGMAGILRGMRLARLDRAATKTCIAALMARGPGRWTIVGAITVPHQDGAIMADRRALNADLAQTCSELGATFFDPTRLVVEYGRTEVLDADGANINEYADVFYPTLGRAMLKVIRPGAAAPRDSAASDTVLADRINSELVALHARSLEELGPSKSGLYAHYQRLMEQGLLVGPRERAALALVARHLPQYDAYAVMRAGLGEAALLIAASGRTVTAYEPNAGRRAAIQRGLDHLLEVGLIEAGRMTVAASLTPDRPPAGRVLGIGLDASEVRDDEAAAPHMRRVPAFAALLIDPRLFLRLRESRDEQDRLVAELTTLGFTDRREYATDGVVWLHRGLRDSSRHLPARHFRNNRRSMRGEPFHRTI
jgi:hypothetical protein